MRPQDRVLATGDFLGEIGAGKHGGLTATTLRTAIQLRQRRAGPTKTMLPRRRSPLINAGNTSAAGLSATDQRGQARVANALVDIGAVEAG